jgi:hypothetical protein
VFTGRIKIAFVNTVCRIIDSRLLLKLIYFYYHFIDLNVRGQEKRNGTGLSQISANYYQDRNLQCTEIDLTSVLNVPK